MPGSQSIQTAPFRNAISTGDIIQNQGDVGSRLQLADLPTTLDVTVK